MRLYIHTTVEVGEVPKKIYNTKHRLVRYAPSTDRQKTHLHTTTENGCKFVPAA